MDIITRLKHCIYDGYRQNILTLVGQEYKTATGLVVLVPKRAILSKMDPGLVEELVNVKAKCLVYQELTLKLNKKTQVYSVMANLTSTMDGYVSWDPDFLM